MEAYTSNLGLLTHSLIFLHNALVFLLKLVFPGSGLVCIPAVSIFFTVKCTATQYWYLKVDGEYDYEDEDEAILHEAKASYYQQINHIISRSIILSADQPYYQQINHIISRSTILSADQPYYQQINHIISRSTILLADLCFRNN